MKKTLQQIWSAYTDATYDYIESFDRFSGEEVDANVSTYVANEWRYVEAAYIANGGEIGTCSGFTTDFICRMLAGRV